MIMSFFTFETGTCVSFKTSYFKPNNFKLNNKCLISFKKGVSGLTITNHFKRSFSINKKGNE